MMKRNSSKHIFSSVMHTVLIVTTSLVLGLTACRSEDLYVHREVLDVNSLSDYFPLAKGNYWKYSGFAAQAVSGGKIVEKPIRITMEVKDVIEFGDVKLCIMSGHPIDAAWALKPEHNKEHIVTIPPKKYGYLFVSNKIFYISEKKLALLIKCLQEPPAHQAKDCWFEGNFLNQDNLEFDFPLFKKKRFGPLTWLGRPDNKYFWYVKDKLIKYSLEKGVVKSVTEFELIHNTFPGRIELRFQQFIGIRKWSYIHHGTKAEVDVTLIDYDLDSNINTN